MDGPGRLALLQHSAGLGKTFLVGGVAASEKLRIRLKLSTAGALALLNFTMDHEMIKTVSKYICVILKMYKLPSVGTSFLSFIIKRL